MPAKIVIENLDKDILELTRQVEARVNDIAASTEGEIEQGSPVDTGFFRFNWNKSYGAPRDTVRGERAADRRFGPPTFGQVGQWFIDSGRVYYTNAVEYAEFLDAGSSGQARQGITEPVAVIIEARFNRVA